VSGAPRWLPPIGWGATIAIFAAAGALLWIVTHWAIPALSAATGIEPILAWFILGGLGVFAPLLVAALLLLRGEALDDVQIWRKRLRFRPMRAADWVWALGALVAIGALSSAIQFVALPRLFGHAQLGPSFLSLAPLTPGRYWILAAWLPFWVLNILGEEILWRGVILPRQEAAMGAHAWLANATGWTLFHLAFGLQLLLVLLPILFILPWVAQRRQSSWVAVVIHAGLNGPGFVAVAFGLV
jgi:membrane protease YdiL (CAAX protease family)